MTIEWLTPLIFTSVVVLIIWRPGGVNEAFPATIGGLLVLGLGLITLADMKDIFNAIEGAATIDISTIIMSAVLYRAGVLQWFARKMIKKANGSGKRLFIYSLMLSFLMTMFFNSDGSILITTPILISLVKELQLTKQKALPILVGSALIATASSTPIAVSNIANLIALKMVGLDLNSYVQLMFVPSIVSIAITSLLLYVIFRRQLRFHYTLSLESNSVSVDSMLFKVGISTVIIVRIGFFVAAAVGFPPELFALVGAIFMLGLYAKRNMKGACSIVCKAPWHVILFAIGMYMLVYSLKNIGLIEVLGNIFDTLGVENLFGYMGVTVVLVTVMSNLMNNLPSVMIGTIMLLNLHLPPEYLQLSYLASIIGGDIGSLLLPMGTLASLLWIHIVSKELSISWKDYMRVSFVVIPISICISLLALFGWGVLILG